MIYELIKLTCIILFIAFILNISLLCYKALNKRIENYNYKINIIYSECK